MTDRATKNQLATTFCLACCAVSIGFASRALIFTPHRAKTPDRFTASERRHVRELLCESLLWRAAGRPVGDPLESLPALSDAQRWAFSAGVEAAPLEELEADLAGRRHARELETDDGGDDDAQ